MAVEARIRELSQRHRTLDRAIEDEVKHPAFDDIKLRQLKRQKLKLKEEMQALSQRAN
jgi:hypothetical protein